MSRQIIGSKGGAGGTFVTKPDTLRSNDSFEILLGLGSGRWKGFTKGLQSLKINGIPLENENGTSNFEDVFVIFADGNPLENQIVNFVLGGGGNTHSVNTQLANDNASGPGGWVTAAVSTPGANFIDLRFVVQQMFYQDKKSIRENTATIQIEMRPAGTSTWIDIFAAPISSSTVYDPNGYRYVEGSRISQLVIYLSKNMFNFGGTGFKAAGAGVGLSITGKTTSPFVKELRVAVPNDGQYANKTWEVRCRLVEKQAVDEDPVSERRSILFETITAVIQEPLGDHPDWDGLVWAKVHGKASDQFNGFPEITSICDTKICQVPPASVYNPDTRAYTNATWDGSFTEAFTTDPAWQIKEFVEDPVHGIAGIYPGATLDKWDALEASKYYSELVSDGKGGTQPRFSISLTINESKDIDEMMQYLAGSVNSYTEDIGNGIWRLKVDKPETPVMLFTEDNVFTEFQYSHSDVDTRYNDWRGTFLDKDLDYETNTVRVFDQADIDANGTRFTEIALIGCDNTQEALRRLMFRLRVALNEFRSVTFQTNRVGRLIHPLDTILVADGSLNPNHLAKSTSRLHSYSGTTLELKRELRLEPNVAYTIQLSTISGEVIERTITNTTAQRGDVTTIHVDSDLPSDIFPDSAVALAASGLAALPVAYRVISIERADDDEDTYTINAIQIDTGKWAAMDNVSADALLAQESSISIPTPGIPASGMFSINEYYTDAQRKRVLVVNWDRPASQFFGGYRVEYRLNNGPWNLVNENQSDSIYELQTPEDGTYQFKITALDRRGIKSNPLIGTFTVDSDVEVTPPAHIKGGLLDRPEQAPYDGFRFTVTDGAVPVTYSWDDEDGWVPESNLVTKGSDIGVEDGATVGMTPAQELGIYQIEADINSLFNTYGSTASAATNTLLVSRYISNYNSDIASTFPRALNPELFSVLPIGGGAPSTISGVRTQTPANVAADNSHIIATQDVYQVTTRGCIDLVAGRIYKVTADVQCTTTDAAGFSASIYGRLLDNDYNYSSDFNAVLSSIQNFTAGERKLITTTIGYQNTSAANNITNTAYKKLRPMVLVNRVANSAAGNTNARSKVYALWVEDVTDVTNSSIFAAISTNQATIAARSAAAAQASTTLVASLTTADINPNSTFDSFTTGAYIPNSWQNWDGVVAAKGRVPGRGVRPNAFRDIAPPGYPSGIYFFGGYAGNNPQYSDQVVGGGKYVLEAEVYLEAGSIFAAGVLLHFFSNTDVYTGEGRISFGLTKDMISGAVPLDGSPGRYYRFQKLVTAPASASRFVIYAMTQWSGFGSVSPGTTIVWHRCGLRQATQAEIDTNTVLPALEASVAVNQGAIATLNSQAAFYETVVAATGSSPAKVRLKAGNGGSAIALIAESITIENPVNGSLVEVARFSNGRAELNNALIRGLQVFPRTDSQIAMSVSLMPIVLFGKDGDLVQYENGLSLGAAPSRIVPDISGLPALPAGSSYDVRALNITNTGFTVRQKVITAPVNVNQSSGAGVNIGGTPQWGANKPTVADASNGNYEFTFSGQIPRTSYFQESEPGTGTYYYVEWQGIVDIYATSSSSGNSFVKVGSVLVTLNYNGSNATLANAYTKTYQKTAVINISQAIGQHGSYEFGVHPVGTGVTVAGFSDVRYVTQTNGGESAVSTLVPWAIYQPPSN